MVMPPNWYIELKKQLSIEFQNRGGTLASQKKGNTRSKDSKNGSTGEAVQLEVVQKIRHINNDGLEKEI